MGSEVGFFTFVFIMCLCFIWVPIIYLSGPGFEFSLYSGYGGTPYRIFPMYLSDHKKASLTLDSWSSAVVGMCDPKAKCGSEFFDQTELSSSQGIKSDSILLLKKMSLVRGSVIYASLSAKHSLTLFLIYDDPYYGDYSRFDSDDDYDYVSRKRTEKRVGYYDDDYESYSEKIVSKAIFKCHNRSCDVSWTVPETSNYIIAIGNDSPFYIDFDSFDALINMVSPASCKMISTCSSHKDCVLSVPSYFKGDSVSIMVDYTSSYYSSSGEIIFDASLGAILGVTIGYFLPVLAFIIVCAVIVMKKKC